MVIVFNLYRSHTSEQAILIFSSRHGKPTAGREGSLVFRCQFPRRQNPSFPLSIHDINSLTHIFQAYNAAASFVPKLTTTVLTYLDPQPDDRILDIGCGDGALTLQIASALSSSGQILGLDASPSMILAAQQTCSRSNHTNCSFHLQDCTRFSKESSAKYLNESWDKVFSNAALHWILRKPETRDDVIRAVHSALKPDGIFVFEMGGFGNCGEVYAALLAALIADGVSPVEARQRSPWFFPSEEWMRNALEETGFEVIKMESEYRPTKLTASDDEDKGGLEGWVKLMAAQFLEAVRDRERAVQFVADILQSIITKHDGTQWIGYVRLRGVARKRT